jgi:hypothetical protein
MDIEFPEYSGLRCLMMPYIQGEPDSIPADYHAYRDIISTLYFSRGDIGYLTIDESPVQQGMAHRCSRAKTSRALHTEAGKIPGRIYVWGGGGWGTRHRVELEPDVAILLANNIDDSCAIWDAIHEDTSLDGDIGHLAEQYPIETATLMKAGEVRQIGIFTPHESLPVQHAANRQFLRILSSGVHGREEYFTVNPLMG